MCEHISLSSRKTKKKHEDLRTPYNYKAIRKNPTNRGRRSSVSIGGPEVLKYDLRSDTRQSDCAAYVPNRL